MKKSIYLIIVLLTLISCSSKKDTSFQKTNFTKGDAVFSIHIIDPNQSIIKLKSYGIYEELDLDEDGKLTDTLNNISESYYTFSDRMNGCGMYIKPGANVRINLNTKSFLNTIKFSGDLQNENNYLKQYFILNRDLSRVNAIQHLAFQDEKTFKTELDSIKNVRYELLNDFDNKYKLDKHFKYLEKNRIFYEWANRMETYEAYRQFALEDTTFHVSNDFYDFRKKVNLENRNLIIVPSYHYYLENHYQKIANNTTKDNEDIFVNYLKIVGKNVKDSIIKERLLFSYALQNLKQTKTKNEFFKTFKKLSTDSLHIEKIKKEYVELDRLTPGHPAPDFKLKDFEGNPVKLSDFKGKYVYIDVWATWCRPCMAEMPYLEKLKEKYKNADIVFVGINLNDFKTDWENYIKKYKPEGVQIYAGGKDNSFRDDYQVYSVPKSILINPWGVISTADAPRPSETELIGLLFDRIKKKYNMKRDYKVKK